jgi:uroporphyrin-III C-methyltransferase/precorrin-2 dehydrogenase/sirohydrochlorin ferrochelatase
VQTPYPLHLDLTGKRVLVVGAGPVAVRRARAAAAAGAVVEVVALDPGSMELPVTQRAFRPSDLDGAWLVLSCTGTVDDEVAAACHDRGTWCVRADDAGASDAWVPAVGQLQDVVVSVTAGGDPRRAMAIRDAILAADLPLERVR